MKFNLGLTRSEYPYFILFVIDAIITISLLSYYTYYHDTVEKNITAISYGILMFILALFWLDEKDVIVFRQRKDRLLKCIICNRTYSSAQSIIEGDEIEPVEQTKTEIKGDKEQDTTITKIKPKPEERVNGIVVNGRLVCDNCISSIKEIFKKCQ